MTKNVWICIEKAEHNFSAYAPEVPGCVSTGKTIEETQKNMIEALTGHLELLVEDGDNLDSITGSFPAPDSERSPSEDEYFTLGRVEVTPLPAKV
jgi:predicted RNase H-like HicB family nuclease